METLSPEIIASSPPLTPFNLKMPSQTLPPLKVLPTWNRTKFRHNKIIRSVPKNKTNVKLELVGSFEHIEQQTQTSPSPSNAHTVVQTSLRSPLKKSDTSANRLRRAFDKKIVFLQSNHEQVLSNLYMELEILKNENKALQFQLVMANGNANNVSANDVLKNDVSIKDQKTDQYKFMKSEITELKKSLGDAHLKNEQLISLIKQRNSCLASVNIPSGKKKKKQEIKRSAKKLSSNSAKERKANYCENEKHTGEELHKDQLKESLTDTQQGTLLHMMDKLEDLQSSEKSVVLPKLDQRSNRSAKYVSDPAALRRITDIYQTKRPEPVSLPVLQAFPANINLTLRQKRAKALHVQRQRSNKDINMALTANRH